MRYKKFKCGILILGLIFLSGIFPFASGEQNASVCCEKTVSGLYCQDVPSEQCASGARQVPTSCESTSYCKPGTCYDSSEGTCLDHTPQIVCNANNGTWSENTPAQCNLGCCILGDQAAFVSLVRCKKLSSFLGIQTNYRLDIKNEMLCVASVKNEEKGACVYEYEFEKTCRFTTRAECVGSAVNRTGSKGEFFKGKLCSAEELGTKCGPTTQTTCVPGKDEVYFLDSCGNPANIYDATKVSDKEYWANIKDKSESCNPANPNANSASCGNCNYPLGSFCRKTEKSDPAKPSYGNYMCKDLNCKNTQNGKSYKHGESWCVYTDEGTEREGDNSVGSRFFKHICINGEEVLEQCADFRQQECIEDKIKTSAGDFAQAACRVNRWQDCTAQKEKTDCENTDRRDCFWMPGDMIINSGNKSRVDAGVCLPKVTPGLKFWEGEDAQQICALGNAQCIVQFEKGLFGGEKCKKNCECLEESWKQQHADLCAALGDCGPKVNWVGQTGYKPGFKVTIGKSRKADD